MKKIVTLIIFGFFALGIISLSAAETEKKLTGLQQILEVQKRGILSGLGSPWEFVRTFQSERQWHPKAWPLSYLPRAVLNFITRAVSGVNDVAILPLYVNLDKDPRPITRRFDLPDYPWKKD